MNVFYGVAPPRDPLLAEREKTHGRFSNTARYAQGIKTVLAELNPSVGPAQREALDMIATKIARIISGAHMTKDHWDDIAGYAKLGSEACD